MNPQPIIYDFLLASFIWTAELLSPLFAHCASPLRAANAKLKRLERQGEVCSEKVFAIHPPGPAELLHVHKSGDKDPPVEQLAWIGESFYRQAPRQVTTWFASANVSKRYGSWAGRNALTSEHRNKINHALLCSSTFLGMLERNPGSALNAWTPEKKVEQEYARERRSGSVPDGVLGANTAVEVLGRYPGRTFLSRKLDSLSESYARVQVWGCRV